MAEKSASLLYGGIDVGGTKILAMIVDENGSVVSTSKKKTKGESGFKSVCERAAVALLEAAEKEGLSFADLDAGIGRLANALGIPEGELRFTFNGVRITDADLMVRMVRIQPDAAGKMADALNQWRERTSVRIVQAQVEAEPEYSSPVPPKLRGARLPRPELAEILGCVPHTIWRWDRAECGPYGYPWRPGRQVAGNVVLCDIDANWSTIDALMQRAHRKDRRWREALERAVERFQESQNPVFSEVIVREERGRRSTECLTG